MTSFLDIFNPKLLYAIDSQTKAFTDLEITNEPDEKRRNAMMKTWLILLNPEYMKTNNINLDNYKALFLAAQDLSNEPIHILESNVPASSGGNQSSLMIEMPNLEMPINFIRKLVDDARIKLRTGTYKDIYRNFPIWRTIYEEIIAYPEEQLEEIEKKYNITKDKRCPRCGEKIPIVGEYGR